MSSPSFKMEQRQHFLALTAAIRLATGSAVEVFAYDASWTTPV